MGTLMIKKETQKDNYITTEVYELVFSRYIDGRNGRIPLDGTLAIKCFIPPGDSIRPADAINEMFDKMRKGVLSRISNDYKAVDKSTIVQQERRIGRWIDDNCSECGQYVYHGDARNFCPNCGAIMIDPARIKGVING